MPPHKPPLRVLVVDDNHLIRRLISLILEGAGFDAVEAKSGEDALELAREERIEARGAEQEHLPAA